MALFMSTPDISIDKQLLDIINRTKEKHDIIKGLTRIKEFSNYRIVFAVHPFLIQSEKRFTDEVFRYLKSIIDMSEARNCQTMDVVLSRDIVTCTLRKFKKIHYLLPKRFIS